jgi:hypothetical protein
MKNSIFKILPFLLMIIISFGCKRDREPAERYKLGSGSYSVNCINCITHGPVGNTYDYTSIRSSFNIDKGDMSKVGAESYLKITYSFSNGGSSSSFIKSYSGLTITGSNVAFDSDWAWGGCASLSLTIQLYTGRGRKSDLLTITIPKPIGSN